jgi:hypothetical protein
MYSSWQQRLRAQVETIHRETDKPLMWSVYRGRTAQQTQLTNTNLSESEFENSYELLEKTLELNKGDGQFFIILKTAKNDAGKSFNFDMTRYNSGYNGQAISGFGNVSGIIELQSKIGDLQRQIDMKDSEYKIAKLEEEIENIQASKTSLVDGIKDLIKEPGIQAILGVLVQKFVGIPPVPGAQIGTLGTHQEPEPQSPGNGAALSASDLQVLMAAVQLFVDAGFENPVQTIYAIGVWSKANPEIAKQYFTAATT